MITLSLGAPQSRGLLNLPLVEFVCVPMHRAPTNQKCEGMAPEGVTPMDTISPRKKGEKQSKVIYGVERNINSFFFFFFENKSSKIKRSESEQEGNL